MEYPRALSRSIYGWWSSSPSSPLTEEQFFLLDTDDSFSNDNNNPRGPDGEEEEELGEGYFPLIEGEIVVQKERDVCLQFLKDRIGGVLLLTNYRMVFVPREASEPLHSVPLGCIDSIDVHYNIMSIVCKYFRVLKIQWVGRNDVRASSMMVTASSMRSSSICNPNLTRFSEAVLDQLATPFVLQQFGQQEASDVVVGAPLRLPHAASKAYDAAAEMKRMGVPSGDWRVTRANSTYEVCRTYPSAVLVPSGLEDETVREAASFRSKGRFPAMTWYSKRSGATISRCSQPLVGIMRARSKADEQLIAGIRQANRSNERLYIFDARPKLNAYANTAKGAGTEIEGYYDKCQLVFLNIDNIHTMRSSQKALFDLLVYSLASDSTSGWYAGIERTGWMEHLHLVLRGALKIVEYVEEKQASVLVHCSDGWDRTSQLSSLAQLLLDPYYRTIDGFQCLIEKEWLAFGHKFADRSCARRMGFWSENESSPIFAQWMDCVYQVMNQVPQAFEFNEMFLVTILDHSYSSRFRTFLGNCAKRRADQKELPCLWEWMNEPHRRRRFRNSAYHVVQETLRPEFHTPAMLSFWKTYYLRFYVRKPCPMSVMGAAVDSDETQQAVLSDANAEGDVVQVKFARTASSLASLGVNAKITEEASKLQIIDDYAPRAKEAPEAELYLASNSGASSCTEEAGLYNRVKSTLGGWIQ